MPEIRQNPINENWVIIATERSKRPSDFPVYRENRKGSENCPFCSGHEKSTPPELWAFREAGSQPDTPGWWVRVVPNKFPALKVEGSLETHREGLYRTMDGVGAHEVIIETAHHDQDLNEMSVEHVEEIIRIWRDRYQDLRRDSRIKYIQIFKNFGSVAGASLEHPHSQLIATPMVPSTFREEMRGIKAHADSTGRCVICDMVNFEAEHRERVVVRSDKFISFCPYASRFPFETWISPREHRFDFGYITEDEIHDLAGVMRASVNKLAAALQQPPYNLVLHSAPVNEPGVEQYHWHIEILPRLTTVAGFEWGTGYFINPTSPEMAASHLKEAAREMMGIETDRETGLH